MHTRTFEERELIESIAQARVKYENIVNEQCIELQTDLPRFHATTMKLNETPLIAKPGQSWVPAQDMVDDYLTKCDKLCHIVPKTFDDRVKILNGANAGLMVVMMCKLGKQSERVQMAILKRYTEIAQRPCVPVEPVPEPPISSAYIPTTFNNPTTMDIRQFRNPDNLLGKRFMLSLEADNVDLYEITGYRRRQNGAVQYEVLWEECDESIVIDADEMMRMLKESHCA